MTTMSSTYQPGEADGYAEPSVPEPCVHEHVEQIGSNSKGEPVVECLACGTTPEGDVCSDCFDLLDDTTAHCDHCGMCLDSLGECADCSDEQEQGECPECGSEGNKYEECPDCDEEYV